MKAETVVPAQGRKANRVLILLVEEIIHSTVKGNARREEKRCSDVNAGVTRIASEPQAVKIAVCARAGDVTMDVEV